MKSDIDQLQNQLQTVFSRYPSILFAYLFGSYATGEQTATSDIDVAIYLKKESVFSFNEILMFHGDCCRTLQRNDVDIIMLNTTKNLVLVEEIICHGKIIYNIDQQLLDEFELKKLHTVYDFKERRRQEIIL